MKKLIIFSLFMFLSQTEFFGQCTTSSCGAGYVCFEGECVPVTTAPPPPGLNVPLDSNLRFLLIGGLFIGGFFFYKKGYLS